MRLPARSPAALSSALMILAAGCSDALPTQPAERQTPEEPAPVSDVVESEFPPVPASADVYHRAAPENPSMIHSVPVTWDSRFVLHGDGTFELQYLDLASNLGFRTFDGKYSRSGPLDSVINFDFGFEPWSRPGGWWATGTLDGSRMSVEYNVVMWLMEFHGGPYVLTTES